MKARLPNSLALAAALFLAMVAGGTALYALSLNALLAARQDVSRQAALLREAQADLRKLPDRLALVKGADGDFRRMAQRGFQGIGDRLDWASAVARAGHDMRTSGEGGTGMQSLSWQLEPQQRHATVADLWVTPMTLRGAPLSAAGVGELLRRLAAEARGSFTVDRCTLITGGDAGQMDCRLLWWNWHGATAEDRVPEAASRDGDTYD